jgi:LmbE family N-acetylglucosaminyl deacetylase
MCTVPTVIHVSPHPDDESIAAPCTLLALRDADWQVINFSVGFGRADQQERRRAELLAALEIAGFEHRESSAMAGISRGDNLNRAYRTLSDELRTLIAETGAELVVGPHPRDGHHGHATVARAIRHAAWTVKTPVTWWMWSVWADLPRPTLIVDCDPRHLQISLDMLDQHAGENRRSDYRDMHLPIRHVNAIRGVEKALGFGATPDDRMRAITHAELLTEVRSEGRRWMIGATRVLDPMNTATTWTPLDDLAILSATRLRPFYRPFVLSALPRFDFPLRPFTVGPLPDRGAAEHRP